MVRWGTGTLPGSGIFLTYLDIIAVDADAVLPEEAVLDEGAPRVQQVHQLVGIHLSQQTTVRPFFLTFPRNIAHQRIKTERQENIGVRNIIPNINKYGTGIFLFNTTI